MVVWGLLGGGNGGGSCVAIGLLWKRGAVGIDCVVLAGGGHGCGSAFFRCRLLACLVWCGMDWRTDTNASSDRGRKVFSILFSSQLGIALVGGSAG